MFKLIWSAVPPATSTLSMCVIPSNPCKPFNWVETLTLIGSNVIWPMLKFAMAREFPTRRNSAMSELVRLASKKKWAYQTIEWKAYSLKAEKAGCAESGEVRFALLMTISMIPLVSASPRTWIEDDEAPRGFPLVSKGDQMLWGIIYRRKSRNDVIAPCDVKIVLNFTDGKTEPKGKFCRGISISKFCLKADLRSDACTELLAAPGAHGVSWEKKSARSPISMERMGSMGTNDLKGTSRSSAMSPSESHWITLPSFWRVERPRAWIGVISPFR
jgi:hypothetical protein